MKERILESVVLDVRPGEEDRFEDAFGEAETLVASMQGYRWHELLRCIEAPSRYLLQIGWTTVEAHTKGFRGSAEYLGWKQLLHPFYEVVPRAEHFERIFSCSSKGFGAAVKEPGRAEGGRVP